MKPNINVIPPGPKAKVVLKRDEKISSKSMGRVYPLVISKASGVNVEDVDGNRFLDFNSGIAVMNLGYSHPKIVEAVKRQSELIMHGAFLEFYSEIPVKFSETLLSLIPSMSRVFLTNSGTESIEAAMKLARYYTKRKYFISFYGSFHGRSLGALSLTSTKTVHRSQFGPFLPVIHVPYANPYRCPIKASKEDCSEACLDYLEDVVFKQEVSPEEVAAIFVEPVQGEGGYIVPPKAFLKGLRKICSEHGILYIDDEVQAGCYRTGRFLAIEHFGVEPDIVCLSKALGGGLPLGAMVCREELMTWPPGSHASTFGGNLVACAAGIAVLEVMKKEKVGARAIKSGAKILRYLQELQGEIEAIGDVRGLGLMIGIEFVEDRESKKPATKLRDKVVLDAFKNGLLLLPAGESVIRLAPPLIMGEPDIDTGLEILAGSIRKYS
jgi:4-aminobutyrate aminotransferase